MKLYELPTWIVDVQEYYIDLIQQGSYPNEADLLVALNASLTTIENEYQRYLSSSDILNTTKKTLINSYSLISSLYVTVNTDPNYPASEFTFDANGIKSFYSLYTYNLPAVASCFTIGNDPLVPLSPVTITDNIGFSSVITSLIQADVAGLRALQEYAIPTTDQILYSMYTDPPIPLKVYPRVTVKDVLLTVLGFQDCLDTFGWEIVGFNI